MPANKRPSIRSIIGDQGQARDVQTVSPIHPSQDVDKTAERQIDSATERQGTSKENNKGRMKTGYSLNRELVRRITILAAVKQTGANELLEEGMQYILDKYERS